MERKMKNIVAIFALVLLIVSLLFIPFGTIKANAEESCPHENSIWTGTKIQLVNDRDTISIIAMTAAKSIMSCLIQ